jgi:glutathione S-transferase
MLKLFEHPLSPYAQKVKLALLEKGIEFTTELPDIFTGPNAAFKAANPRLEVPTLADGDTSVFDSTIILEYVEDKWPAPPLLPATPAARARVRMLEEVCDTYYEAINWGLYEIRFFKRAEGELADEMVARAGRQIAGVDAYLERALGGAAWFNGAGFGWGDLAVFPAVTAAEFNGFPPAPGTALADWHARAKARPSAERVVREAMESLAGFAELPGLVASGQFVREYRDHRLEWMLRTGGARIVMDGMAKGNIRFSAEMD